MVNDTQVQDSTKEASETRCPLCKEKVPQDKVVAHKETCEHRHPVPTITTGNPGSERIQPVMQG